MSELPPDGTDAREQVAVLSLVHQRDKTVTHFQFQRIEGEKVLNFLRRIGARGFALGTGFRSGGSFAFETVFLAFFLVGHIAGDDKDEPRENPERQQGQAGHKAEDEQHHGHHAQNAGVVGELGQEFFAHLRFSRSAGNNHARRDGNDNGRNGGNQAIADGQQRKRGQSLIPAHAFLDDADEDAADEVDEGDEQTGGHVPLHKFASAVHGAVKIRFTAQVVAAQGCFLFINESGVKVGFNGHLFAGHGVKGEAGRYFGDTGGACGDDHLVENEQNHEDNRADDITAADHEFSKGLDDFACGRRPLIAIEQDQTGGRHVERQAQQGRDQQQGGENGKFQRRGHEHACQQDEQGQRNTEAEHDIKKKCGHGNEHDHQDDDDARAQHHVALAGEALIIQFWGRYIDCHLPDSFFASAHARCRSFDSEYTAFRRPHSPPNLVFSGMCGAQRPFGANCTAHVAGAYAESVPCVEKAYLSQRGKGRFAVLVGRGCG